MEKQPVYQFGEFRLDPSQKILLRDGQHVHLELKSFLVLLALVEAQGRVLGKNELMKKIWPETFVEEGSLTKNISRLRKVLSKGNESADFIETIAKVGYRFIAPLIRIEDAKAELLLRTGLSK